MYSKVEACPLRVDNSLLLSGYRLFSMTIVHFYSGTYQDTGRMKSEFTAEATVCLFFDVFFVISYESKQKQRPIESSLGMIACITEENETIPYYPSQQKVRPKQHFYLQPRAILVL